MKKILWILPLLTLPVLAAYAEDTQQAGSTVLTNTSSHDAAGHDANDDNGHDGAGHDAGDDKGGHEHGGHDGGGHDGGKGGDD